MFYYLTGTITLMEANLAVIDCGGIGFACHTTSYTQSRLRLNEQCRLYTYCNIREDAFDIFGFASREELRYFELLLGVSGVGPKAALSLLSATTPEGFALAVMSGNEKALMAAQGVGKKMAQRVILELRDKLGGEHMELDFSGGTASASVPTGGNVQLAAAALAELGYGTQEISAALKKVDAQGLSAEEIIRLCLRAMVAG